MSRVSIDRKNCTLAWQFFPLFFHAWVPPQKICKNQVDFSLLGHKLVIGPLDLSTETQQELIISQPSIFRCKFLRFLFHIHPKFPMFLFRFKAGVRSYLPT